MRNQLFGKADWRRSLLAAVAGVTLSTAGIASAAINPVTNDAAGAAGLATALSSPSADVTGASFTAVPPGGTPHGVADAPLSSFPTDDSTFAIMTSGNASFADDANSSGSTGVALGGGNVRGNSDFDVSILRIDLDVPAFGANCLTIDFQFYSDEYPEYVNSAFNDAFIAELDTSTWTTAGSAITAPDNFAFDPVGNEISINAAGNTSMTAANAAGTTYDGATPLLSASTQVTPGAHSLYLTIFDQGDQILDSAVFLDNLTVGFVPNPAVNCVPGATPKTFEIALDPATADNLRGTDHTVTATLLEEQAPLAGATISFEVIGANVASGSDTTDAAGEAPFTYTGINAGSDVITACYDADTDGDCDAVASATKNWLNNPPVCSDAFADPGTLWPPNHEGVPIVIAGVTDADGDPLTITATSVTQDEAVTGKGLGSGNTTPDAQLSPLAVRSERNGNPKTPGDGRVYHVSFTADDGQGGSCNGTVFVCVPHDQRPGSTCSDGGPLYNSIP